MSPKRTRTALRVLLAFTMVFGLGAGATGGVAAAPSDDGVAASDFGETCVDGPTDGKKCIDTTEIYIPGGEGPFGTQYAGICPDPNVPFA